MQYANDFKDFKEFAGWGKEKEDKEGNKSPKHGKKISWVDKKDPRLFNDIRWER